MRLDNPTHHIPVLLKQVREAFTMPPGLILDATAGGGGHAQILLELGHEVIACDRDPAAVERLRWRLLGKPLDSTPKIRIEHSDFSGVSRFAPVDGILADLGFSSDQLGDLSRGFSFDSVAPPDMRMDPRSPLSAADLIEQYSPEDLARVLREFGEESSAWKIACALAGRRFTSSRELSDEISRVKGPRRFRPKGSKSGRGFRPIHPATKTFQALRIAVNDELGQLRSLLDQAPSLLNPGGRIAVITFHSLEDRIVKNAFREWEGICRCPPRLPICACGVKRIAFALWKGSQNADSEEVSRNPRSRSARIRAMEMAGAINGAGSASAGRTCAGGNKE